MLCTDGGGPWSEDREESEKGWDSEDNGGIGVRRSRDISHCARRENRTQPRFMSDCRDAKTDNLSASEKN